MLTPSVKYAHIFTEGGFFFTESTPIASLIVFDISKSHQNLKKISSNMFFQLANMTSLYFKLNFKMQISNKR